MNNQALLFSLLAWNCVLTAGILCACLAIAGLKQRLRDADSCTALWRDRWQNRLDDLARNLSDRQKAGEPEPEESPRSRVPRQFSDLQMSDRVKILKMHRHGRTPEQISQLLAQPPAHVQMLIKVHGIVMRQWNPKVVEAAGLKKKTEQTRNFIDRGDSEVGRATT